MSKQPSQEKNVSVTNFKADIKDKLLKVNCCYCHEEVEKTNKLDCIICKKSFCHNCVSNEKQGSDLKKKVFNSYICTTCLSNTNSGVNRKRNKKEESMGRDELKGPMTNSGDNYEEYNSDFEGAKNPDSLLSISISMDDKDKTNNRKQIEEMEVDDDGILDIDNLQMIVTPPSELYDYQEVMKKRKKLNIKSKDETFNSKQGSNIIKIQKQVIKKASNREIINYAEEVAPIASAEQTMTKRKRKINLERKVQTSSRPEVKPVNFSNVAQAVECHQCKRDCPLSTVFNCLNKICNKSYCIECIGKYSKSEIFGECYSCKKICTCNDCKLGITSNNNLNHSKSKHVVEIDDFVIIEDNDDQDSDSYAEKDRSEDKDDEDDHDEHKYDLPLQEDQPQIKAEIKQKYVEPAQNSKLRVPQAKINTKINKFKTSKKEEPPIEVKLDRPSTTNDLPVMTFKLEKSVVESTKLNYFENQTKVEQIIQRVSNSNLNSTKNKTKRDCFICKTTKHITQFKLKCFTDFMVFLHNHYVNVVKVNHKDPSNEHLFNNVEWMKHYYSKYFLKSYSDNSQSYKTIKHLCVACLDKKMNSENGFFELYNIMLTMNFKSEFYPKSLNCQPSNPPPSNPLPLPPNNIFNTKLNENLSFYEGAGKSKNESNTNKSDQPIIPSLLNSNISPFINNSLPPGASGLSNLMNLSSNTALGQKLLNLPESSNMNLSNFMSMMSNFSNNQPNMLNQNGEGQKFGVNNALGLIGSLGLKNIESGSGFPTIKLPSNISNPLISRVNLNLNQQNTTQEGSQNTISQQLSVNKDNTNQQPQIISNLNPQIAQNLSIPPSKTPINIPQVPNIVIPQPPSQIHPPLQSQPSATANSQTQPISMPQTQPLNLNQFQTQTNANSLIPPNLQSSIMPSQTINTMPNVSQLKSQILPNLNQKVQQKGPNHPPNSASNTGNPVLNLSSDNKNTQMIYLIINQILQQRSNSMLNPNTKTGADQNPISLALQGLSQNLINNNVQSIQQRLQSSGDQSNLNFLGEALKHAGGSQSQVNTQSQPTETTATNKIQVANTEPNKLIEKPKLTNNPETQTQTSEEIKNIVSNTVPKAANEENNTAGNAPQSEIGKEQTNSIINTDSQNNNSKHPILEHFKFKTTPGPGVPKKIFNNTIAPKMEVDDIKVEEKKEKIVQPPANTNQSTNLPKEQIDRANTLAEANKNNKNMSVILDELKKQFFSIQYFSLLQKLFISYIFKNLELYVEQMFKYHVLSEIVTNYIISMTQDKDKAVVDYIKYLKTITSIGSNLSNALNSNIQGLKSNGIKTFKSLEDSLKSNMKSVIDNFGEAYTTINSDGIKDETKNALLNGMNDIKNLNMSYTSHFTSQLNPLLNILFNKKEEEKNKEKTDQKDGNEPNSEVKKEGIEGNLDQNMINEKLRLFLQDKNNMKNIGLNLNNMMSKIGTTLPINLKKEENPVNHKKSEVIQANFDASSEMGLMASDLGKKTENLEQNNKGNNLSKENRRPSDIESSFDENFSEREDDMEIEVQNSKHEKSPNKQSPNTKPKISSEFMEIDDNEVVLPKAEQYQPIETSNADNSHEPQADFSEVNKISEMQPETNIEVKYEDMGIAEEKLEANTNEDQVDESRMKIEETN